VNNDEADFLIAEAEVSAFLDRVPGDVRADLARLPRDLDSILACAIGSVSTHRLRGLTLARVASILREFGQPDLAAAVPDEPSPLGGYVVARGPRAFVFVESARTLYYERFTLAHEAGHLWHEWLKPGADACALVDAPDWYRAAVDGEAREREAAANAFAAELLMPRREVRRLAERELGADPSVDRCLVALEERFRASHTALALQLAKTGFIRWSEFRRVRARDTALAKMRVEYDCA